MKKILYSWWLKLIAVLLIFFSIIGGISSIFCMALVSEARDEQVLKEDIWEEVFRHRAFYLMDQYHNREGDLDLLEDGNLSYAVIAANQFELSSVDLSEDSVYLYRSPDFESSYQMDISAGVKTDEDSYLSYRYAENSLLGMLLGETYCTDFDFADWQNIFFSDFVVDSSTGIIYADTLMGYYPVEKICVNSANAYIGEFRDGYYYESNGEKLSNDYYQNSNVVINIEEYSFCVIFTGDNLVTEGTSQSTNRIYAALTDSEQIQDDIFLPETASIKNIFGREGEFRITYLNSTEDMVHYWVLGTVRSDLAKSDMFSYASECVEFLWKFAKQGTMWFSLCFLILIAAAGYLIWAAGHRPDRKDIALRWADKIPYGILVVALAFAEMAVWGLLAILAELWGAYLFPDKFICLLALLLLFLSYGASVLWLGSTIVRIKAKKFWRYTLIYLIYKPFRKIFRKICRAFQGLQQHLPLVVVAAVGFVVITFIESILLSVGIYDPSGGCIFLYILVKWAELVLLIWISLQLMRLNEGSRRIASGDLSAPIETKGLVWEFKKHGENINKVGDNISLAVEERMKSERFRTELITNVSHDIKTPLTSIINYVDLIKKQEITDATMAEYIEVLDRQSARLKKLIEDLMEASKASTGNLEVHLEKCNLSVLLVQMVGEFEERAAENSLSFVVSSSENPVYIMADGRHLWRIFDNLLNNACKYAAPFTRIYVELASKEEEIIITLKNISKSQLNISSEELLERFVRGDSSRNTEGSGLGLSIAQSLTELMGGCMNLVIDGDLFKVILQFPEMK